MCGATGTFVGKVPPWLVWKAESISIDTSLTAASSRLSEERPDFSTRDERGGSVRRVPSHPGPGEGLASPRWGKVLSCVLIWECWGTLGETNWFPNLDKQKGYLTFFFGQN